MSYNCSTSHDIARYRPGIHRLMKRALFLLPITAIAVASISTIPVNPATASTYVRVSSWMMNYSQEKCIKYAIQVANMAGFTNSQVTVKPKPKEYPSSQFYSYTPNGPYAFAVNCDEKTGTAAFAISGIIAERTDQLFTKIIRTYDEVVR